MRTFSRLVVAAVAAVAALAFAGSALASFGPRLVVSGGANGTTRIGVVVAAADDPTAKTTIYVPAAYAVTTASPGTKLGSVTATASAADLSGVVLPLTGELDAIAPTPTTDATAQACGVTPSQTWDLHLSAAGQTLDIPMFVVAVAAPEQAAGFGAKIVVCLPPPDVPVGTPGRAVFGAKLLSATFSSSAITLPAGAGDYRWTSLWTPYTPGTGQPNVAGTVETQTLQRLPVKLTTAIARKRVVATKTIKVKGKKKKVKIVGTAVGFASGVSENGAAASSAAITTTGLGKKLGAAKGTFLMIGLKSVRLTVTAVFDSDSGSVPTGTPTAATDLFFHDLGAAGCTPTPIFGGLPCIDATAGGGRVTSTVVVTAYRK